MRVLAFTMVYNEVVNLPIWLEYYGRNFGPENLLILDHSSNDGSTKNLAAYNHIRLPRDEFDENARCRLVSSIQRSLHPHYDIILFSDCDEIIVPDPNKHANLSDYVQTFAASEALAVRTLGLNIVHIPEFESDFVIGRPVLDQRKFVYFKSIYCKPLLTKSPITWDVGFHHCDLNAGVDPDLYLFHLKDVDKSASLRRLEVTRSLKWATSHVKTRVGMHQRFDDDTYISYFFDRHASNFKTFGDTPFEFTAEARKIDVEGLTGFERGVSIVPDRFKGIF